MKTKRIFSLALVVAMLASMFTSVNIVSAQENSSVDADFDKYKVTGVYYDASEDTSNVGTGTGMHMNASNTRVYNVSTEEDLAAFKAHSDYGKAYTYSYAQGLTDEDGNPLLGEDGKQLTETITVETTVGGAIETAISNKSASYASYTGGDHAYNFATYEGKPALHGIPGVATQFVGNWKEYLTAPCMYWKITDDYFASTDTNATFVIQYYDNAGKFGVRYSKQGGSSNVFSVTKGGTNTWVTKVFHVTDAMLNKNLTATGLIDNKHSGRFESNSETYISKFAILKTSDYKKIAAGLDVDFENDTMCQFIRNSDLVEIEPFNYTDKVDTDISTAGISGLSVSRNDYANAADPAPYVKVVEDPANSENLVLATYHPGTGTTGGTNQINQEVTKTLDANFDSDYVIMSHKFYFTSGGYVRFYPSFTFKKYSDASTTSGVGIMGMINGNTVYQEGNTTIYPAVAVTPGKWAEYDFVIDTKDMKAYLYIDHQFTYTFDFTQGSNIAKPSKTDYYISGINNYTWRFDRQSGAGTAYFDDIQIRTVSAAQAAAIDDYMTSIPGEVTDGTVLPATTAFTKSAITWSVVTENTGVSVAADGTVTVPAEFYGNVEYKATLVNGTEKTYSILTCGFRANVVKDTFDEYVYYKGKNISTNPIPGYTVAANEHKVSTIEENPDGPATDLVLKRTQTIKESPTINNTRTLNTGDLNSDYILWSLKYKIPAQYFRINLYFHYKDANGNISTSSSAGMNFIINPASITNEMAPSILGVTEGASFTSGKFANKWVEFKVLVDTANNNARIYIDDEYLYTHTIIRNRSAAVADGVNVCGIRLAEFQPDWAAGVLSAPAYFDDMSVSKMSTEDTVIADLKMLDMPEAVQNGTVLPAKTDIAGKTITWTTNNDAVTVDANGIVTCATSVNTDVTFTATVNDGTINRSKSYVAQVGLDPVYVSYTFGKREDTSVGGILALAGEGYNTFTSNGYKVNNHIVPTTGSSNYESGPLNAGDQAAPRFTVSNASGTDTRTALHSIKYYRVNKTQERVFQIYFDTNESISNDYNDLYMEVDYLDTPLGSGINVGFGRASTGAHQDGVAVINCTGTGEWKTAVIHLTDAKPNVNSLVSGKHDFRLAARDIVHGCYISGIRLYSANAANIDGEGNVSVKPEVKSAAEATNTKSLTVNRGDITNDRGKIYADKLITPTFTGKVRLYAVIYDHTGDLKDVAVSDYINVTEGVPVEIETAFTTKTFDIYNDQLACFFWDEDLKPVE